MQLNDLNITYVPENTCFFVLAFLFTIAVMLSPTTKLPHPTIVFAINGTRLPIRHDTARLSRRRETAHHEQVTMSASSPFLQVPYSEHTLSPQQEHNTVVTQARRKQTYVYTLTRPGSARSSVRQRTTTLQQTQVYPKVSVSTADLLGCLERKHSSLTLEADEAWLEFSYKGNVSGAPRLRMPSTCWFQVRGRAWEVVSLLIFNTTFSSGNQLVVHSQITARHGYDYDPTSWVAPGLERVMTSNVANVSIEINDVNADFSLRAQFRVVGKRELRRLEIRQVTACLGRTN